MPNTHSQILPINANNMCENFCSKIFSIMTTGIYKSIGFYHLEARKQDSGVGNENVLSLIYSTKRYIRDC